MRGCLAAWTAAWAAALIAFAAPALGQAPARSAPGEAALIDACLAEARSSSARRACIGRGAEACLGAGGGAACWRRERGAWDGVLDRAFTAALRGADDEDRVRLVEAQRAWLAYLDATCAYQPLLRAQGLDECVATATALRAVELMAARHPAVP